MKTYKLYLIRHGLTQGNIDGIYVGGGLDMPLCAEGEAQLREMMLRYTYPAPPIVFASPMARALQSADILFPAARERIVLEELRENRFGEFEGKSISVLMEDERFAKWLDPKSDFVPQGGESGAAFAHRTLAALQSILRWQMQRGEQEAACVTHGGVIMSMLSQMALPRRDAAQWMTDNGCGFTLRTEPALFMRDGLVEAVEILPQGYLT